MAKITDGMPEVVFSTAADSAQAKRTSRLANAGTLRKIRAGIYTSNLDSPIEAVTARNWRAIVEHLLPGAVVAYRSAIDARPSDGKLFLVKGERAKRISLPGLELVVVPGAAHLAEPPAQDTPYGRLFVSSEPRRLLENLATGKGASERTAGRSAIEANLERILTMRGEKGLNAIRDAARDIAPKLRLDKEFDALNEIVGALLATHDSKVLHARSARARAAGRPYDPDRIAVFDALHEALHKTIFEHVSDAAPGQLALENFSFFEAYFSNYIEGTEFTVEEAEDIVFNGKIIENRSEDSHDVQGTFAAIIGERWRKRPAGTEDEFLAWIKSVNALVMQARADMRPGEWKEKMNQAGSSLFVLPDLVPGTLREGFARIQSLQDPVARALMAMFVVAEVHPFTDGNGRTARIAMNAYLSHADLSRIIIPTIYRDDYVSPLKALTHNLTAAPYVKAMTTAQRWSASFDWSQPRNDVRAALRMCNAFEEDHSEFRLIFPDRRNSAPVETSN